jgi:hypothetical protein
MDQREIKIRYYYSNGEHWFFRDFRLEEIENGFPYEVLTDSPLYKSYKLTHRAQLTGILDINKTEIAEGDIVKTWLNYHGEPTEPMFKSKIEYNIHVGAWQISYLNVNNHFVNDTIGFKYFLEVIGNLSENPELINP